MAYTGTVKLSSGLTKLNPNGTYKLADSADVYYNDEQSVKDKLDDTDKWISLFPNESNKLIYSKGNIYTSEPLLLENIQIVDNTADLNKCLSKTGFNFNSTFTSWQPYVVTTADSIMGNGDNSSDIVKSIRAGWNSSTNGVVYNYLNTSRVTGYISNDSYNNFDITISLGCLWHYVQEGYTIFPHFTAIDWQAFFPACKIDTNAKKFYGIAVSMNTAYNTGSEGREAVTGRHTISICVVNLPIGKSCPTTNTLKLYSTLILTNNQGLTIVPYDHLLCNGGAINSKEGTYLGDDTEITSSSIRAHLIRKGAIIKITFSDVYPSSENGEDKNAETVDTYDYKSWDLRHSIREDRYVEIDLQNYTITYVQNDGTVISNDLSTAVDSSSWETTKEAIDALVEEGCMAYELSSNPGSSWRSSTPSDKIIDSLNDKVYEWNGTGWLMTNENPLSIFTGSHISYNKETLKLFYSNGRLIYQISSFSSGLNSESSGILQETDPVFSGSPAAGITSNDISSWNNKSEFSGDYNDLTNKPTLFLTCTEDDIKSAINSASIAVHYINDINENYEL